jgi:hypothetical protein
MTFKEKVSRFENFCESQSKYQLKSKMILLDDIENFYYNLHQKQVKDETDLELHEFAIILIHSKIIKTLNCNSNLLRKGHYSEFRSLLRNVLELIYLSKFLMRNPEKAESWLDGAQYGFGYIANPLNIPDDIRDIYGKMCDFTHPNFRGTKDNLILSNRSENIDFLMIPVYRKKCALSLISIQLYFAFIAMNHFFECFKKFNNFDTDDEKHLNRIKSKILKQIKSPTQYNQKIRFKDSYLFTP